MWNDKNYYFWNLMEWNQHSTYSKTFLIGMIFQMIFNFFLEYKMLWNEMEYTFHFLIITGQFFFGMRMN